jgi:YD repeat-containing protein
VTVSDGTGETTRTIRLVVLNVNAAPNFDDIRYWELAEGQPVSFRAFAFDPDNPTYQPPERNAQGQLILVDETPRTVQVSATGLPPGAVFDTDTLMFRWAPTFIQAGEYQVTFTAVDDGNGTGVPLTTVTTAVIVVANANRPPTITAIDNQTMNQGVVLEVPVMVNDPDNNPLTITVQGLPSFASYVPGEGIPGGPAGVIRFNPGILTRGNYTITVIARDDGDGGGEAAVQTAMESFVLTVSAPNEPPRLAPLGDRVALVGKPLVIDILAADPDLEPLTYTVSGLPTGATLTPGVVYGTARLMWTPTSNDLGVFGVTFTVTDGGNGNVARAASHSRTLRVVVRDRNAAPELSAIGDRTVAEGQSLTIQLVASDADNDSVHFSATNLPPGARFDVETGQFTWTPNFFQEGTYAGLTFTTSDGNKSDSETITLRVTNTNQSPILVPLHTQRGREGTELSFAIAAGDIDGDRLTFSATNLPAGALFDAQTRVFTWTPGYEQAGLYTVTFTANDGSLSDTMQVPIRIDNVNRAPTIAVTDHSAVLGRALSFSVVSADLDLGTTLTFSAVGLPFGSAFDSATGAFAWTPGPTQAGDHVVAFSVTDGDSTVSKSVVLRVFSETPKPRVTIELTPSFPGVPGQKIQVQVIASALAPIVQKSLRIDGQVIALDAQGRAEFTPPRSGLFALEATATDADGFVNAETGVLKVRDPLDNQAPVAQLNPRLRNAKLTTPTAITATVSDTNLESWLVEKAPLGSNAFTRLASGSTAITNATLFTLDPGALANGFYRLRLTARDISGRTTQHEVLVEASTATKPSQYLTSQTDAQVILAGKTINLTRMYDSLERDRAGTFGPGWRLVATDVRLEAGVMPTGREDLGVYEPLRQGSRLYITLPDGKRVGFTFNPTRLQIPGLTYFVPAWTADTGVPWQLESARTLLAQGGNRFYDLQTGQPYNPASGEFAGPEYRLTGPDGVVYELSTARGVEVEVRTDGTRIHYSDAGITTSTGESVQFLHDEAGRLTKVFAPDGTQLVYTYDESGNLLGARNLALGQSSRYGYSRTDDHLLTMAVPAGAVGQAIRHGAPPVAFPLKGDLGGAGQFSAAVLTGTLGASGTDRYALGIRPSELRATASGKVFVAVTIESANSTLQPALPVISGMMPALSRTEAGSAFAIYALDHDGLYLLELAGANPTTSGAYRLTMAIVGDIDGNGTVDGVDGQLLTLALGTRLGEPGYSLSADVDRSGLIDGADVALQAGNSGFAANRPPAVMTRTLLTHVDLPLSTSLAGLASDPEDDVVYYRIVGATNGTARLSPDGRTVTFTPTAGYSGPAAFTIQADDGYNASSATDVAVTVSDAPLVRMDFAERNPRLEVGQSTKVIVIGDFADQEDVVLPGSYVTFQTTASGVASISATGVVTAVVEGATTVTARRGAIEAATAIGVGLPDDPTQQFLAVLGMDVYPDAVSLPLGGSRQILVSLLDEVDLSPASTGTRYYVSNSQIVSVTADGKLSALAVGSATVVVINGAAEAVIPVRVEEARQGPIVLSNEGGVVAGPGGLMVQVAPGALAGPTTVSIAPVTQAALPLPTVAGYDFAGGFSLDVGTVPLNQPVQLAIPVDSSIVPGTEILFYRAGTYVDETGAEIPIWWQVDNGFVGADGIARTASPPYGGATISGTYYGGVPNRTMTGKASGSVTASLGGSQDADLFAVTASIGGGSAVGILASLFSGFFVDLNVAVSKLKFVYLPKNDLPKVTTVDVRVNPGQLTKVQISLNVPSPSASDPGAAPIIKSARMDIREINGSFRHVLVLSGQRFLFNNPVDPSHRGGNIADLKVRFQVGGESKLIDVTPLSGSATELIVPIPQTVTIGLASFSVVRPQRVVRLETGGKTTLTEIEKISAPVRFSPPTDGYAFTAMRLADPSTSLRQVAAVNTKTYQEVARIPIGKDGQPHAIVVTNDRTRAYVTLRGTDQIAVIDPIALQQVDANLDNNKPNQPPTIDTIELKRTGLAGLLPNGNGFMITIDPKDEFAYVTDERSWNVWVIDIRPSSQTFHKVVKTISLGGLATSLTADGLRGLAFNANGTRLYVAASEKKLIGAKKADGRVFVIDTEYKAGTNKQYQEQIGEIGAGLEPYGVTATLDPNVMTFTNRQETQGNHPSKRDLRGFNVIRENNKTWTATPFPLNFELTNKTGLEDQTQSLEVNDGQAIVFIPRGTFGNKTDYALVGGHNRPIPWGGLILGTDGSSNNSVDRDPLFLSSIDVNLSKKRPAGSTIGLIKDPLGKPELISATRGIPFGFLDSLTVSADMRRLYASYSEAEIVGPAADAGGLFVYDVEEMIKAAEKIPQVTALSGDLLKKHALNNVNPDGTLTPDVGARFNAAIDVRADYRVWRDGPVPQGPPPSNSPLYNSALGLVFGVPGAPTTPSARAPVALPGRPFGVALSDNPIELLEPQGVAQPQGTSFTPSFKYKVGVPKEMYSFSQVYVSTVPAGEGLFPSDTPRELESIYKWFEDGNNNRIVNGEFGLGTGDTRTYQLPSNRELTAGQTYYWGVELHTKDGRVYRQWAPFQTAPVKPPAGTTTFTSVTVVTHGFQPGLGSDAIPEEWVQLGEKISQAGGGGLVLVYEKDTGRWINTTTAKEVSSGDLSSNIGKPLVLLPNWVRESDISDSGFSEAAGDAIFAAIAYLDETAGGDHRQRILGSVLRSPLHIIGHSRGTIVNSEIIQRLGTYFPGVTNIQMTTLDPHDKPQPSLEFDIHGLIKKILKASSILKKTPKSTFAPEKDPTKILLGIGKTMAKRLLVAQVIAALVPDKLYYSDFKEPEVRVWNNVRFADNYYQNVAPHDQGFTVTPNGRSLPGADYEVHLNSRPGFNDDQFPAIPHTRVWQQWYAGTVDLSMAEFGGLGIPFTSYKVFNEILRSRADGVAFGDYTDGARRDWYSRGSGAVNDTSPWEGILTGWYFSQLGGGTDNSPAQKPRTHATTEDNSDPTLRIDPWEVAIPNSAVPSVLNGDFELGTMHLENRFPYLANEVPGWSFHGGSAGLIDAARNFIVDAGAGNHALEMSSVGSAVGPHNVRHNRMYIPDVERAEGVRFSVRVINPNPTEILDVLYRDPQSGVETLLGTVTLPSATSGFEDYFFCLPHDVRGRVGQLAFRLLDVSGGPIDSKIWLDDVYLSKGPITLAPMATVGEGESARLDGTILPEFVRVPRVITVEWGDGATSSVQVAAGQTSFTAFHVYRDDNPTGTPQDKLTVLARLANTNCAASTEVLVLNRIPNRLIADLSTSVVQEGSPVHLTVSFEDDGVDDTHTIEIDWGEGPIFQSTIVAGHQTVFTYTYADDNPTGTSADFHRIAVTIRDDDTGSASTSNQLTVTNVEPVVSAGGNRSVHVGQSLTLSATVQDPGADTHQYLWNINGVTSTLTSPSVTFSVPGIYFVTLDVTDDDGGRGTDSFFVEVRQPLRLNGTTVGSQGAILTETNLSQLTLAAMKRWERAGLTSQQFAQLQRVRFTIDDLADGYLGGAISVGSDDAPVVFLDRDAAGVGWFIDSTPSTDEEFVLGTADSRVTGIDLLTVLTHELGHILGLDHNEHPGDVMGEFLSAGVRRLPGVGEWTIADAFSGWVDATGPTASSTSELAPLLASSSMIEAGSLARAGGPATKNRQEPHRLAEPTAAVSTTIDPLFAALTNLNWSAAAEHAATPALLWHRGRAERSQLAMETLTPPGSAPLAGGPLWDERRKGQTSELLPLDQLFGFFDGTETERNWLAELIPGVWPPRKRE